MAKEITPKDPEAEAKDADQKDEKSAAERETARKTATCKIK